MFKSAEREQFRTYRLSKEIRFWLERQCKPYGSGGTGPTL